LIAAGEAPALKIVGFPVALALAAILAGGCETMAKMESVEGRHWQLVEIGGLPAVASAEPAHLFLDPGPPLRAAGVLACNRFAASYMLLGNSLTFGPAMATRMACPESAAQEAAFTRTLELVRGWRLVEGRLELLDAKNASLAVFDAGPRH